MVSPLFVSPYFSLITKALIWFLTYVPIFRSHYWKTRASPYKQNVYSYVFFTKEDNESSLKSVGVPVRVWRAIFLGMVSPLSVSPYFSLITNALIWFLTYVPIYRSHYWKTRASPYKQNVYSYVFLTKEDNESSPKSLGVPVRVWRAIFQAWFLPCLYPISQSYYWYSHEYSYQKSAP